MLRFAGRVLRYFTTAEMSSNNKITRYGAISCDDSEKWGFSEATTGRLAEIHSRDGEEWIPFHAIRGDVPTIEDLHKYKGFIISGSVCSANDNIDWILKLQEFIRGAASLENATNRPKLIGVCFGHQLIAKTLGGKVDLNPDKDFVLQTEEVKAVGEAEKVGSIKGLFDNGPVRLVECHGECVTKLPEGAVPLGTSATCKHEVVLFRDNILGVQAHPEMLIEEVRNLVLPGISKRYNWSREKVQEADESFNMDLGAATMNKVMKNFLSE